MWREFDDFAHSCIGLWRRVREGKGKDEHGNQVVLANPEWLRLYIDAGGPLVEDYGAQELIDGVRVVERVKNGG